MMKRLHILSAVIFAWLLIYNFLLPCHYFAICVSALTQGISEFLPISSSMHQNLLLQLTGFPPQDSTQLVIMHFGTLLATVVYLWPSTLRLCKQSLKAIGHKTYVAPYLIWVIATLPAVILGGAMHYMRLDQWVRDHEHFLAPAFSIIFGGLLAYYARPTYKKTLTTLPTRLSRYREFSSQQRPKIWHAPSPLSPSHKAYINYKALIKIGLWQSFALLPGVSRLGSCLTQLYQEGCSTNQAFYRGIWLSIPVQAGALLLKILSVKLTLNSGHLLGFITTFTVGLATLCMLSQWVQARNGWFFGLYRIALGTIMLVTLFLPRFL